MPFENVLKIMSVVAIISIFVGFSILCIETKNLAILTIKRFIIFIVILPHLGIHFSLNNRRQITTTVIFYSCMCQVDRHIDPG